MCLSGPHRHRPPDLLSFQPLLDRLARESREFARLAVVNGTSLLWVAHAQGATKGLVYQPSLTSNTVPLYATASGKAWLATLGSDQAVRMIVRNRGLDDADRYGPNVLRSIEAVLREVKRTPQRGYGIATSEAEPGVNALAAAICSVADGKAVGTVSVAGPSVRMSEARIQELAPLVRQCASELAGPWPLRGASAPGVAPKSDAVAA